MQHTSSILSRSDFSFRALPVLLFVLTVSACSGYRALSIDRLEADYAAAVEDAAIPRQDEIANQLTPVSPGSKMLRWKEIEGDQYVLAVTWTGVVTYYPEEGLYHTGNYPIWVTLSPELQKRAKEIKLERFEDKTLRLKQLLGLPPTVEKNYFMEVWVRPRDLFRPCPDPEVSDRTCELCFPEGVDPMHREWVNTLRIESYYGCQGDNYPWTQLGYTYDWAGKNKNHFGLSEFVINRESRIYINRILPTDQYLAEILSNG